jgi:hypothetical protein
MNRYSISVHHHPQQSSSSSSSRSTKGRISSISVVPSLHAIPLAVTSYIMQWLSLNDLVSLSLTSTISRSIVKNHIGISRTLYCSSITRQSISLLKWCRSLHYFYFYLPWSKQFGFSLHHQPHIETEITNEVQYSLSPDLSWLTCVRSSFYYEH